MPYYLNVQVVENEQMNNLTIYNFKNKDFNLSVAHK